MIALLSVMAVEGVTIAGLEFAQSMNTDVVQAIHR